MDLHASRLIRPVTPLSEPDLIYISLLIMFCIIEYVKNRTLNPWIEQCFSKSGHASVSYFKSTNYISYFDKRMLNLYIICLKTVIWIL